MGTKKTITIIAAMANNRAIGLDGRMPWHLPAELQHFKKTTMGKPVVMGRKTWEAIGRPLPGRQNIVVSRQPGYKAPGCDCVDSLESAIAVAAGTGLMIIGGGQLYRQALPLAGRMVLTRVDCTPEADTWFPRWREEDWRVVFSEQHSADDRNPFDYVIYELERVNASCP
jgi:dihydrofolate reductase